MKLHIGILSEGCWKWGRYSRAVAIANSLTSDRDVMALKRITLLLILFLTVVNCQSLPQLKLFANNQTNNSFIDFYKVSYNGGALMCQTNARNCCIDSSIGGWKDERGNPVYEGANGTTCLYVTRGDGVISLNRNRSCTNHTSGLWRCDIPDCSGEMQSLYAYIGDDGQLETQWVLLTLPNDVHRTTCQLSDYELYSTHWAQCKCSWIHYLLSYSWRTCHKCPVDSKWIYNSNTYRPWDQSAHTEHISGLCLWQQI